MWPKTVNDLAMLLVSQSEHATSFIKNLTHSFNQLLSSHYVACIVLDVQFLKPCVNYG